MKKIEGETVVGSPHSAKRYEHAPSMCGRCWLDCPQPIITVVVSESVRKGMRSYGTCYVCEEDGEIYAVK